MGRVASAAGARARSSIAATPDIGKELRQSHCPAPPQPFGQSGFGPIASLLVVGDDRHRFPPRVSLSGEILAARPQPGVNQLAVTPSGEVYVAGVAGAGFPVTASAPQVCSEASDTNAFVAHLDTHGTLLDATYAGQSAFTSALALAGDGSVLLAGNVRSRIRFGGAGWSAPACLSPGVLNSATLTADYPVVPGQLAR